MTEVLTKAAGFILLIALAYILKLRGFFKPEHKDIIAKMALMITLPCVAISGFKSFTYDVSYLVAIVLGVVVNVAGLSIGTLLSLKSSKDKRALMMMSTAGYNVGIFTIPFVSSFLTSSALLGVMMFDIGNSIMIFGSSAAITDAIVNKHTGNPVPAIIKKLLSMPAFIAYFTMFIISLVGIRLPDAVFTITDIGASATSFLAMMMIGIMLDFNIPKAEILSVSWVIALRYIFSAVVATIIFFSPLPYEVRKGLMVVVFAPLSTASVVFAQALGCKSSSVGIVGSLTIMLSIIFMVGIIIFI